MGQKTGTSNIEKNVIIKATQKALVMEYLKIWEHVTVEFNERKSGATHLHNKLRQIFQVFMKQRKILANTEIKLQK